MSLGSLDSFVATLQRASCASHILDGVRIEKHPLLPCHKDDALLIPKREGVKREFWLSDDGEVWGFSAVTDSKPIIYLSEKMFDSLKTLKIGLPEPVSGAQCADQVLSISTPSGRNSAFFSKFANEEVRADEDN